MIGDKKELITLMRGHRSKWYRLACFGSAKHYRADGTCKHTDEVMISLKPGIKVRTKIDGWGGKKPSNIAEIDRLDRAEARKADTP